MGISLYRVSGQSNNTSPTWFKSTVEKFPLLNHLWSGEVGWGECSGENQLVTLYPCQLDLYGASSANSKHPGSVGKFTTPAHLQNTHESGTVLLLWLYLLRLVVRGLLVSHQPFHACFGIKPRKYQCRNPRFKRLQTQIYLTTLFNHFLSLQRNIDRMYKLGQNHPETNRNYHTSPSPFHQGPYFLKWRSVLFPFSRSKASIGWLVSLEVRLFRRIFRPIGGFPHLAHKGLPKISVTGW